MGRHRAMRNCILMMMMILLNFFFIEKERITRSVATKGTREGTGRGTIVRVLFDAETINGIWPICSALEMNTYQ